MGAYGYISLIALFCYLFLFILFLSSENNKIVNSFRMLLLSMICWTGGSVLMRLQFVPSYVFWYHVSIAGLLLMTYEYYRFVNAFAEKESSFISIVYFIALSICCIINIPNGILLHWPDIVNDSDNILVVYNDITCLVVILFGITAVVILDMLYILIKTSKDNLRLRKQLNPISLGIIIMFLGNLALVLLPSTKGFPIDILVGIVNAFLLMYAMIKRKLFKLKMLTSEGLCYGISTCMTVILCYNLLPYLQDFLGRNFIGYEKYFMVIELTISLITVLVISKLWRSIVKNVFVKDETIQSENLKKFSDTVSKSLRLKDILEEISTTITNNFDIYDVNICMKCLKTSTYNMLYSSQPLADLTFNLREDNPIILWINKNSECLLFDEFIYSMEYKSMWQSEKRQLASMGIDCCIGLKNDNELMGIVMISSNRAKNKMSYNDISFISSVTSIASIAIKNSQMYEKVYQEAMTDELTGILNRRYFYELIQKEFTENKDGSLALIIINIDDFKLYNQLYGVKQGDIALKTMAEIICGSIGDNGHVARYSGKEFAILLPNYDVYRAKALTESIRDQISIIGKTEESYSLKALTISAGISVAPYEAKTVKELIDNADMAVYNVKKSGKNAIKIFDSLVAGEDTPELDHAHIYTEYESTIYALTAAIDTKDHYTFKHSNNVAYYATELAKAIHLNSDMIEIVRQAALLHDIGKIGIPENILNKPGKLTEQEYEIIKGHVESSIGIVRHLPSLNYVIPAILGHHERYDGKGYPRRISGEDIPMTARILCIADSFDAMTSKRCYKDAFPTTKVLDILEKEAGAQFDPQLIKLFIQLIKSNKIVIADLKVTT